MNSERQRQIEQRAYALWIAEGRPDGRHEEHWRQAAREIAAEESAGSVQKRTRQRISPGRSLQRRKKAIA